MPLISLGTTAQMLVEHNKKRKTLSFTNNNASAIVYLSDKPDPSSSDCKWILYPYETAYFSKAEGDFPERAFFGISDTAATSIVVGFQNAEK